MSTVYGVPTGYTLTGRLANHQPTRANKTSLPSQHNVLLLLYDVERSAYKSSKRALTSKRSSLEESMTQCL
jgi:hypothetical protein